MRNVILLPFLMLLVGCASGVRLQKLVSTERFVTRDQSLGRLAEVESASGFPGEDRVGYRPEPVQYGGRSFVRPVVVTNRGSVSVRLIDPEATLTWWVRHPGVFPTGWQSIRSVSGGVHGAVPSETRWLEPSFDGVMQLPVHQLYNVYNGYEFRHGDFLLAEVQRDGQQTERYVFRSRQLGFRGKAGAGVLFQIPLPRPGPRPGLLSPVFALTASVGFRPATRSPVWTWMGDHMSVVVGLGVGSTAVPGGVGIDELDTVLNAALFGGGIELYDTVSIQMFGNVSSAFRNASENPATLAVGIDAVQFGRLTRDATTRLFKRNSLDR